MVRKPLYWIFLIVVTGFGIEISEDTVVTSTGHDYDTVYFKNETNVAITIDSITIQFLDGDSADSVMGSECTDQMDCYFFAGWVYYGTTISSLKNLGEKKFLLQDSSGNPETIEINAQDSVSFEIRQIVNCPICGRMPSYPAATVFLYTMYTSDGNSEEFVVINDDVTAANKYYSIGKRLNNTTRTTNIQKQFNFFGQRIVKRQKFPAIIIQNRSKVISKLRTK